MRPGPRPAVLVVAGSDSSAGAGLARDLRVLAEIGVEATVAVTAVTAQSDRQVRSVLPMPAGLVGDQIETALETRPISAVKIGMLGNRGIVETVADRLESLAGVPIVLDPVLVSSSGGVLLDGPGRAAMVARLFPLLALLTPNLPEAAALLGETPAGDDEAVARQARRLRSLGPRAVLLKGGHGEGAMAIDTLILGAGASLRLGAPRLAATARGTGCALATAIAAFLALGRDLPEACRMAKEHVFQDLRQRQGSQQP